jgi:F-type H+-transporting ATPase subunit gamma
MAKARRILKRVKAVRNIRTVTRTMEMVASARFRKAHDGAVATRPYTDHLTDLVGDLLARSGEGVLHHPLLEEPARVTCDVLMVLTSNTGLCGPYNALVLATARERLKQLQAAGGQVSVQVAGKRGVQHFHYLRIKVDKAYLDSKHAPSYEQVAEMADAFMEDFLAGRIGGLEVAYTQYFRSGQQSPAVAQLLPLSQIEPPPRPDGRRAAEYEFLPSPRELLDCLLPAVVRLRLYQCFLDAAVTEQVSRIRAMRAATENADEMIHDLTVLYNRTRQAQITTELAEIIGGAAGVA